MEIIDVNSYLFIRNHTIAETFLRYTALSLLENGAGQSVLDLA
jgi:hypothetical protein